LFVEGEVYSLRIISFDGVGRFKAALMIIGLLPTCKAAYWGDGDTDLFRSLFETEIIASGKEGGGKG